MKSFINTIESIFTDKNSGLKKNGILKIPMYQREYQWTEERIVDLIQDIKSNPKFLGIIILDEKDDYYEIVDGQQRLTTVFLILIHMHNLMHEKECSREKTVIKKYLYNECNILRIQNETVGQYIKSNNGKINITISDDEDIYDQAVTFNEAMEVIEKSIRYDELLNFKNKLNTSSFLILLRDSSSSNFDQIEQVFLDINEKSKKLDYASIFKGYCFKNYNEDYYDTLKEYWIRLKKVATKCKCFDKFTLDEYIYTYLISTYNKSIPKSLSVSGRHILEGKNMDETEKILLPMIEFGETVIKFYNQIDKTDYKFEDVCKDSNSYSNSSGYLIENAKRYLKFLISFKSAQYQKLPLCYFIYKIYDENLKEQITYKEFMQISANLFAYSMFFILSSEKKSKNNIDNTIVDIFKSGNFKLSSLINASKELRKKQLLDFKIPDKNKGFDQLAGLYTLMDGFESQNNRINNTYFNSGSQEYNLEHFIIPNNNRAKITITNESKREELLSGKHKKDKNKLINYIIIDKRLNEKMYDLNVVEKIQIIKDYYNGTKLPKHISIFIKHIESLESFKDICEKISSDTLDKSVLKEKYERFLNEYFSEEQERILLDKLTSQLKESFQNNG